MKRNQTPLDLGLSLLRSLAVQGMVAGLIVGGVTPPLYGQMRQLPGGEGALSQPRQVQPEPRQPPMQAPGTRPVAPAPALGLQRIPTQIEVFRITTFNLSDAERQAFQREPQTVLTNLLTRSGQTVRRVVIRPEDVDRLLRGGRAADKCMYHVVYPENEKSIWITTDCP